MALILIVVLWTVMLSVTFTRKFFATSEALMQTLVATFMTLRSMFFAFLKNSFTFLTKPFEWIGMLVRWGRLVEILSASRTYHDI